MKNNTRVYIVFGFLTLLLGVGFYIWYTSYRVGRNTNRLNIFGGGGNAATQTAANNITDKLVKAPEEKLFGSALTEKVGIDLPKLSV